MRSKLVKIIRHRKKKISDFSLHYCVTLVLKAAVTQNDSDKCFLTPTAFQRNCLMKEEAERIMRHVHWWHRLYSALLPFGNWHFFVVGFCRSSHLWIRLRDKLELILGLNVFLNEIHSFKSMKWSFWYHLWNSDVEQNPTSRDQKENFHLGGANLQTTRGRHRLVILLETTQVDDWMFLGSY